METPEIRWTKRDELAIAYFTVGQGPPDIVYCPNWTNNIEIFWEQGPFGLIMKPLAAMGRLIAFDQPGTGISDPVALNELPPIEQWMEDVRIVMDAAGSERAALVAIGAGGALACLFAASHPERVSSLVLLGAFARFMRAEDYPAGYPEHTREPGLKAWLDVWGTGRQVLTTAPSVAHDEREINIMGRAERHSASPGVARAYFSLINDLDVREVLPAIRVPTLVIHRTGDRWIRVEHARYLATHIPGAKLVEVPGDDHFFMFSDTDFVMSEIREFLTGSRAYQGDTDRVLATLLFTDIVDSTRRASQIGDARWRELLTAHNAAVRALLERFRGKEIKSTGDGFLATFDGPARAVRCAKAIVDETRRLGLEVRIGLHTGEVEMLGADVGGIAVHIGARVMAAAGSGEILVSSSVPPLVLGSGIEFDDRGSHEFKGVREPWHLFSVLH
ncbi:MAG: adenylate/guanylate cyclase domain-containing protein [Actinomycetota bacterium]